MWTKAKPTISCRFTLVLQGVDVDTEGLKDALLGIGYTGSLVSYKDNTVCLDFERQAENVYAAIKEAVKEIESMSIGASVIIAIPERKEDNIQELLADFYTVRPKLCSF